MSNLAVLLASGLAQGRSDAGGAASVLFSLIMMLCWLVLLILIIAGVWKIFTKANKPGWASIVPIYNVIVLLEIVGRPVWWVILFFIPFVNFVIAMIVYLDLAKSFGKGSGYAVGLLLLPIVFMPMLGFGDARYQGPSAT